MQNPKRRQYKYAKSRYGVKNWCEYEAGLRRRGDLTVWLSDEALAAWQAPPSGRPGGQRRYADIAIEAALTIRMVFHLPLRQTEGFLYSLMQLLDVDLPIPDHTTLSRRLQTLGEIPFQPATHGQLHLLIDSTGLRIHVGHLRKPPREQSLAQAAPGCRCRQRPDRRLRLDPSPHPGQHAGAGPAGADRSPAGVPVCGWHLRQEERLRGGTEPS